MQRLRTSLLTLVLALVASLTAAQVHAQTAPPVTAGTRLFFDHDGLNVDTWGYKIDATGWVTVTPSKGAQVGTTTPAIFAYSIPFPAVTPGTHTIAIRACNAAGCAESDPFSFTMLAIPSKPLNLRIGAAQE